jgi:hypothetical protein
MPLFERQLIPFYVLILLVSSSSYGQYYNTVVEADIYLEMNNEFIEIEGTAFNKSEINQSLKYVFSTIKTDPETGDLIKNDQTGRFVIAPNTKTKLSETIINSKDPTRIILLLLLYDTEDNIVGKDRIVLNDDPGSNDPDAVKLETSVDEEDVGGINVNSRDVNSNAEDGVVLSGIVVEDTKTKPGSDFYKIFYQSYLAQKIKTNEIITIKEVFALGRNTKLEVKVGSVNIFEFFLRPKEDFLKEMSRYTMTRVIDYIKRQSKIVQRY